MGDTLFSYGTYARRTISSHSHSHQVIKKNNETVLTEYTTAPAAQQEDSEIESNVKNDGESTTSAHVG
jgi:hypothetical protein